MARYTPHNQTDIKEMLQSVGCETIEQLFEPLPAGVLLNRKLHIPDGKSPLEVKRRLKEYSNKNKVFHTIYRGAGAYNHYIPSAVNHLSCRTEMLSTYTPYQAETSQGVLQVIFEFQTMMCELTGLDVSNASVYDGATAAAEACKMSLEKKRNQIVIAESINQETMQVIQTYLAPLNVEILIAPVHHGVVDKSWFEAIISDKTAAVYIDQLNRFGLIEDIEPISQIARKHKALTIVGVNPIAAAILPSANEVGADIAVGEGQPLGLPLSFGGPYLGFITAKSALLRKMPGRIVGETIDTEGRRAFVLTLQAREQHIKREKSLSSICSNQAHCAYRATVYLSTVGGEGLKQVARHCSSNAHYLAARLMEIQGFELLYKGEFFHEFVTKSTMSSQKIVSKLEEHNILGGLPINENEILWCATEMNTREEMDLLVSILSEMKA